MSIGSLTIACVCVHARVSVPLVCVLCVREHSAKGA